MGSSFPGSSPRSHSQAIRSASDGCWLQFPVGAIDLIRQRRWIIAVTAWTPSVAGRDCPAVIGSSGDDGRRDVGLDGGGGDGGFLVRGHTADGFLRRRWLPIAAGIPAIQDSGNVCWRDVPGRVTHVILPPGG